VTKAQAIAIGMGLGLVFGVALHNYPIGIIIGLALGGAIYLVRSRRGQ
jgi:hypothetical protein